MKFFTDMVFTGCYCMVMKRELKVRINSLHDIAERIRQLGGQFIADGTYEHVYFRQPEGMVLKLLKSPQGTYRITMRRVEGRLKIISQEKVYNGAVAADELTDRYGVQKRIVNYRQVYNYGQNELSLNDIQGVGAFLIIDSASPSIELVSKLGIGHTDMTYAIL